MSEARSAFLATLRAGLRGAPPRLIDETIADYRAHFDEGAAAGRGDEDIAAALGDPLVLADELRVEAGINDWQAARSPRTALQLVNSVVSLGALNAAVAVIALPVLIILAAILASAIVLVVTGAWMLFAGDALGPQFGLFVRILASIGLISAAVSLFALTALAATALLDLLGRYTRLHYRVLSIQPNGKS